MSVATISKVSDSQDFGSITSLSVGKIRTDGATQPRDVLSNDTIIEYADLMREGVVFPPLIVFYDGTSYWLADGYHRINGYKRAKIAMAPCDLRMGDKRDALLYSCRANSDHGLRRSNADKRRSVMKLLNDDEWGTWTDARLAEICGVSPPMIASLRVHSINPAARSSFRKAIRGGKEVIVETHREPRTTTKVEECVPVPVRAYTVPVQRTDENAIHKYAKALKAADIKFRQNVQTAFGPASFETDEALIQVVPILSASSFREAFATILYQRSQHCPAKKAVIVGRIMEDARPWIAKARLWKVEVKSVD